jgi:type VI secretion system secreted protein VgrG
MPHPFRIKTPLPAEDLLLQSLSVKEALSMPSEMHAQLLSPRSDLDVDKLLGKPVTFEIELRDDAKRHFHGYITRLSQGGGTSRYNGYQIAVRPWLWFLSRTTDCRIYQHQSVPDIVKAVFEDHGIASFDFKLFREYRKWDYCVQYRESDLSFVSRLLEHEGIYYRFDHADGQHKMILLDSASAHDPQPHGAQRLPLYANASAAPPDIDYVSRWSTARAVRPGKFAFRDYDFEKPSDKLLVEGKRPHKYDHADEESYDYPGFYTQAADGTQYLDNRMDEVYSDHEVFHGATNAHDLTSGFTFRLQRHPRADQNAEYLVTGTHIRANNGSIDAIATAGSGTAGAVPGLQCTFTALLASQQFRPTRRTPKALVQGPQTALVVGAAGNEIETDKYGRVKVQFHWDRYGKKDEKSSCWVRVAQAWAGKNYGAIFTPRIGQEVIVDFLEGDPDQPIITGRVYNAEQMPPWDLPANATQSGILTRSSKGGAYANANAIRFEDKAGSEQLWIHAEKNQDIEVENDETHWVGHDRKKTIDHDETTTVKHDRTETVGNNETITIGVNRSETVGSNETIGIGSNRTETVGANETITIGGNRTITVSKSETATVALQRTHTVGINETITVGAAQEITVGAAQVFTIGADQTTTVGANQSNSIGADQSTDVGSNQTSSIGSDRSVTVGGTQTTSVSKERTTSIGEDDKLSVGKNLVITASDSVSITTGSASITMKKDGTITIKGKDITIDGSGKINVKASANVVMKGSKILQN